VRKVGKESVDYTLGRPAMRCGDCRFFQAVSRLCAKVEGKVDAMYWCRLFRAR
jgi:hypothetical protein